MAARASARVCATDPSRFAKWGMITVRSAPNRFGVRLFGRCRWRSSRCVSAEKDLTGSGDIGVEILMSVSPGGWGFYLALVAPISAS
jgi:hypothetical protein